MPADAKLSLRVNTDLANALRLRASAEDLTLSAFAVKTLQLAVQGDPEQDRLEQFERRLGRLEQMAGVE